MCSLVINFRKSQQYHTQSIMFSKSAANDSRQNEKTLHNKLCSKHLVKKNKWEIQNFFPFFSMAKIIQEANRFIYVSCVNVDRHCIISKSDFVFLTRMVLQLVRSDRNKYGIGE